MKRKKKIMQIPKVKTGKERERGGKSSNKWEVVEEKKKLNRPGLREGMEYNKYHVGIRARLKVVWGKVGRNNASGVKQGDGEGGEKKGVYKRCRGTRGGF